MVDKQYRDQRDRHIIGIISGAAFNFLGMWMVLSPQKPKHSTIEKATVSVMKDLWGMECGLVLNAIGLVIIIMMVLGLRKLRKSKTNV